MSDKRRFYLFACCISIIVLWLFLWFQYRYDRNQTRAAAETSVSNLSKAFEENILGTIRHLDEFLVTLRRDFPQHQNQIPALIASFNRHSDKDLIIQLSITDSRGMMIYNSKGMPDKPLDLSDREHIRVHLDGREDKLFISKPVLGRVSKKWSIQFTRKILNRDGMFGGVAVLSVDPDYFTSFYKSIDVGRKGVITLVGMDGVIRARSSAATGGRDPIGVEIPRDNPQIDPAKPAVGIYYAPSSVDGISRIVSYRRLKNYPMVVRVALAEEEAFSDLRWHRNNLLLQGVLASLGLVMILWLTMRYHTRQLFLTEELKNVNRSLQKRTDELGDSNELLEREVAERQRAQEELAVKQHQLEQVNSSLQERVDRSIAELREKDQFMINQARLATMGEMIGNIAHQWRQPLNALAMLLGNIKSAHQYNELTPEYIEKSVDKGNHLIGKMSTTINDFRNFFRPDKSMSDFPVLEQIRQAVSLVEAGLKSQNIEVHLDAPQDLILTGFPNEYSQVLLNLLTNARDAIRESGISAGRIRIRLFTSDSNGCVAVSDNGGGIPADVINRIFEPYFSTKSMGTGIGLYMSKMIIERSMNGIIEAHNIEGGAEFVVVSPLGGIPV